MDIRDKNSVFKNKKGQLKALWKRIADRMWIFIIVFFLLATFVFGEANIARHIHYRNRISELKKELKEVKTQYKKDSLRLEEIRANKHGVEHTARELYLMKRPEEIIFLIKDSPENN